MVKVLQVTNFAHLNVLDEVNPKATNQPRGCNVASLKHELEVWIILVLGWQPYQWLYEISIYGYTTYTYIYIENIYDYICMYVFIHAYIHTWHFSKKMKEIVYQLLIISVDLMVVSSSLWGGTQLNSPFLQGSASKPARFAQFFSHPFPDMFYVFLTVCDFRIRNSRCNTRPLNLRDVLVNFCVIQQFSYFFQVAGQICRIYM